jgi:NAD(P)H-hydrate epimerase
MSELEGARVVTSEEMRLVETRSFEAGYSSDSYMQQAGLAIAEHIRLFITKNNLPPKVTLIVGKGNNGGDAYVAAIELLKKGFSIQAFYLYVDKECSELNQKYFHEFLKHQGVAILLKENMKLEFDAKAPLLDGLLGTGFQGPVTGLLKQTIDCVNHSGAPIFAVDIPSGLHGTTGITGGTCIRAKETLYLTFPKVGFFLGQGYEYVGKLVRINFGLPQSYENLVKYSSCLLNEEIIAEYLPQIKRTRHKYQRGYVVALAGSPGMAGAANLACLAALRAGAGIVRLFHPQGMEKELCSSFQELIKTPLDPYYPEVLEKELSRAKALLIGPGLGKEYLVEHLFLALLEKITIPCVIDADALTPFAQKAKNYPKEVILTPHYQEMLRCLGLETIDTEEMLFQRCQAFVQEKKVTLVLKGAPTRIFHPNTPCLIVARGDPGMATAGSGDVLTGVLAALLAQGLSSREAAALGVYLHARSGEFAALEKTSYSVIASDLIDKLAEVFCELKIN